MVRSRCFDPRSHAGSDHRQHPAPEQGLVSIHAPMRGATVAAEEVGADAVVSIHAPMRGATRTMGKVFIFSEFRSTLPCGERPPRRRPSPQRRCGFDPRSHAGSDLAAYFYAEVWMSFRSTLPCGERPPAASSSRPARCFDPRSHAGSDGRACRGRSGPGGFDPRSHAGSDPEHVAARRHLVVSIHAPMRGATRARGGRWIGEGVSIHAPMRGATFGFPAGIAARLFRSTLPCGERPRMTSFCARVIWFRSTLPCGERRCPACSSSVPRPFRSTLPCGERLGIAAPTPYNWTFRSTLPCGERQAIEDAAQHQISFDPRSHAGSDGRAG